MKIFKKVHCKAYLKKHKDGVFLRCSKKVETKFGEISQPVSDQRWWNEDEKIEVKAIQDVYENGMWTEKELKDLSSFEGETVEKLYRKRTEEEFDGFLVGVTNIIVSGRIGTDYDMYPGDMGGGLRGLYHLTKYTDYQKVGVVYFKNNSKRYVLLDDMEVIE